MPAIGFGTYRVNGLAGVDTIVHALENGYRLIPCSVLGGTIMTESKYTLYVLDGCPFCTKVLTYMKEHGIELPVVSITGNEAARAELVRVGGKAQCPCLFIDGKPMYESGDIVDYLAKTFA